MKKVKIPSRLNLFLSLVLVSAVTFIGCDNDSDDGGTSGMTELNIVETAQENDNFSILVQAITDAGLTAALEADGPFTVFAPTNEAFNDLPEGTLESLTNEQLQEILQFHVVEGTVASADLEASQDVASLLGEELLVEAEGEVLVNGYSSVTTADIEASNGIIHAVDAVLLPAGIREANIVDQANELGTFTSLVGAVDQVGLTSTLKYKGDFTLFAPTDDAFASLPDGLLASLTNEQVTEILTYHVLSGEVFSNQLDPEQAVESLSEEDVFITSNNDGVFVNGSASVVTADVDVSNGVIHAIDAVILPNEFLDVVQIAQKNYNLTTLVDLVVDADLVTTLKGDGPFTVLAPTNDAFAEISATLDGLTASEVEEVLLYHVAAQEALAGDLTDGMTIETVQGEDITVTIDAENNVFFNGDVGVVTVDLEGTNGVVHIIDGVLIPPSFTN